LAEEFDARIEKRTSPVQLYLASLDEPALGRTVTETSVPTALECSPSDAGSAAKPAAYALSGEFPSTLESLL